VLDAKGKPVRGVMIHVEQLRHDFLFGCNFYRFARVGDPKREQQYRERFAALMNSATLGFYWASYEPQRGQPNYEYTDQAVEWCRERQLLCKGHPLVWDHRAASPQWLPDDFKEIERLSNARVREIVSRYKGRIDVWDVVNEPTHLPDTWNKTKMAEWGKALGSVPYTREPLRIARAANPNATLLVNDYRLERPYLKILETLRADGVPFDVVGLQSHMHDGVWPLKKTWDMCETYSRLGLPLHFTEITVVSGPRTGPGENWGATTPEGEAGQAQAVAEFYTALFSHPSVEAITWWDLSDHGAWQRAPAGLLRADMSPKPVYEQLKALIKGQWWTRANARTDSRGEVALRAFFGMHRVKAELPGGRVLEKEIHLKRGTENRFEIAVK
jgi:endo-1,4-beta-xylanase